MQPKKKEAGPGVSGLVFLRFAYFLSALSVSKKMIGDFR